MNQMEEGEDDGWTEGPAYDESSAEDNPNGGRSVVAPSAHPAGSSASYSAGATAAESGDDPQADEVGDVVSLDDDELDDYVYDPTIEAFVYSGRGGYSASGGSDAGSGSTGRLSRLHARNLVPPPFWVGALARMPGAKITIGIYRIPFYMVPLIVCGFCCVLGALGLLLFALSRLQDSTLPEDDPLLDLTLDAHVLRGSATRLQVAWEAVWPPREDDRVAVYVLRSQGGERFIGSRSVAESPTWMFGRGSLPFLLVNMRKPYAIYLEKADGERLSHRAVAVFEDPDAPANERLSLVGDRVGARDAMLLTFTLGSGSGVNDDAIPRGGGEGGDGDFPYQESTVVVEYGPSADNLRFASTAPYRTYRAGDLCGDPAVEQFVDPGRVHVARLAGLAGSAEVYYRILSAPGAPPTSLRRVRVPAHIASGRSDVTVRMVVFGDLGLAPRFGVDAGDYVQPEAAATMRLLQAIAVGAAGANETTTLPVDAMLLLGDAVYANGYLWKWDYWLHEVARFASHVPLMAVVGNHEYDYDGQPFMPTWAPYDAESGGECGVPYTVQFPPPHAPVTGSHGSFWYSFNVGPVHWLVLSSEHDFLDGSAQQQFAARDLAAVDRAATPWVLVATHRPFYTSSVPHLDDSFLAPFRNAFEGLFLRSRVHAVFSGHVHAFEQTCAGLHGGVCGIPGAPVYVVAGNSGAPDFTSWVSDQPPAWVAARGRAKGIVRLEASSDTLRVYMQAVSSPNDRLFDFQMIRLGSLPNSLTQFSQIYP